MEARAVVLLALMSAAAQVLAQPTEPRAFAAIGVAHANFNVRSGELQGAPGTTPPGITATVNNVSTAAIEVKYRITPDWSADLGFGYPPRLELSARGAAVGISKVAEAKAWFPHLTVSYHALTDSIVSPYLGAGIHRTWFSSERAEPAYSAAVQGTATDVKVKADMGPVLRLGAEVKLPGGWSLDATYLRYWIKTQATLTTQTPGAGDVERRIDLRAKPDIFALMVGSAF